MKKTPSSQSAFFIFRVTAALVLSLSGVFLALLGFGAFANVFAQTFVQSRISLPAAGEKPASDEVQLSPADKNGRFVYLIEFAEPGMLQRQGRVGEQRFNPDTPEAQSHRAELMAEQAAHVQKMTRTLRRPLDVTHYFLATHSGIAGRFTMEEAKVIRTLRGVASVERERVYSPTTFRGPSFIGANTIWDGTSVPPGGSGTRGQGIVIAMLDTGVDSTHPSFANDATCGHGQGGAPSKLISSLDCSSSGPGGICNGPNAEDNNGHGSHTASTSGGNTLDSTAVPPPIPLPPFTQISGVAPCANIRAYKVCPVQCPSADIQAGMDSVLLHGDVSVMNFSISGGNSPWIDNDRKKLDLVAAGVVVASSAGNTSATIVDPVGNVAHLGPWNMTVAASTRDGDFSARVSAAGPGTPPADTQNIALNRGSDSPIGETLTNFPIRHFLGQGEAEGCTAGEDTAPPDLIPFPPGFFTGSIALIRRGNCPFTKKIQNAFNAGATAVLIRNQLAAPINMLTTGQPPIPAYSMNLEPGLALNAFVDANPTNATVNFEIIPSQGDILAGFSLRGPSALASLTKPDITGPGVNIYAAQPLKVVPAGYGNISGTSMSSPHLAGAAALVRAVNPTWTAPEVKSALMMTASLTGTKEDGITPWNPDDVGNGRVDLTKAARAGLVMHETFINFLGADPSTGGNPSTLNIPSVRNLNCNSSCTWTRTVRNTRTVPSNWTAAGVPTTTGVQISVQPSNFSFTGGLGETQQLTITATPTTNLSAITFGNVVLTEGNPLTPVAHLSVAIQGGLAVGAVSRKSHGAAGSFDVELPVSGTPGVESRHGGATNDHQLIVTFGSSVSVGGSPQASVTSGTATIGSGGVSNGGAVSVSGSTVTVPLTNVANAQTVVVTLTSVTTAVGNGSVVIRMGVLLGDTNGSRNVDATDVSETRAGSGQPVAGGNFRFDVNADGLANSGDVAIVRSRVGTFLP